MTLRIKIDLASIAICGNQKTTFEKLNKTAEWAIRMDANCVLVGTLSHAKFCLRLVEDENRQSDVLYVSEEVKRRWYPHIESTGGCLDQKAPRKSRL